MTAGGGRSHSSLAGAFVSGRSNYDRSQQRCIAGSHRGVIVWSTRATQTEVNYVGNRFRLKVQTDRTDGVFNRHDRGSAETTSNSEANFVSHQTRLGSNSVEANIVACAGQLVRAGCETEITGNV